MLALVLCLAQSVSALPSALPAQGEMVVRIDVWTRAPEGLPLEPVALAIGVRGWDQPLVPASELDARIVHVVPGRTLETTVAIPDDIPRTVGVWVQVAEPGFQQQHVFVSRTPGKEPLECAVPVEPGGTLFGTLHAPVDPGGGCVRLAGPSGSPRCTVRAGGDFALHFETAGPHELAAFVPGGYVRVRALDLDPLAPPRVVALESQPGATISGRVLDPDGVPVVPYEVAAVPLGFEAPDGDFQMAWEASALGRPVAVDDKGRFELPDLAPGRHVLFGAFAGGPPQLLSNESIEVGTRGVMLTAFVHHLAVTVLHAQGHALDTAKGHQLGGSDGLLRFERLDAPDFEGPVFQGRIAVRRVDPGSRWRVTYASLGAPPVMIVRDVPDEPWLVHETLHVAPPVEPARLRLRLRVDDRPYSSGYEIAAWTASGANAIVDPYRASWESVALAPGAYRIEVTPTIGPLLCGPWDLDELVPPFGPAAFDVELAPGEEREQALVLPPCRRLAIDLARPVQGDAAALADLDDLLALWKAIGLARVTLRSPETGLELHPEFSIDLRGSGSRLDFLVSPGIAPGRRSLSVSGIAPGRYALLVELPDGQRLEREIDVQGPRVTEVTLP